MTAKAAKVEKVMEVVEPVVEETIEALETVERIPRLRLNGTTKKQQIVILAVTAGVAAGVAGTLAWKIATKRANLKIDELVEHEVNETRAFYQNVNKPPIEEVAASRLPEPTDEDVVAAAELVKQYQGKVPYDKPEVSRVIATETPQVEVTNVFVEGEPVIVDFDYEAEIAQRSEDAPYIISYDEFQQGEKEYVQNSLTWYEGDDTLTDNADQPIPDVDNVVGEDNMRRFGHGSRDPNIVYVRNDTLENDFEVARNKTGYAAAVLGFKHSDRPGSRKDRRFPRDEE